MKQCPTCNRTYADDGFTFCLSDGALLSAPYDPAKEKPVSTLQSSGPPPTAVLPLGNKSAAQSESRENDPAPLPPTIASPDSAAPKPDPNQSILGQPVSSSPKRKLVPYIAISVLVLMVLMGIGIVYVFEIGKSKCPDVIVRCSSDSTRTECYVAEDPHNSNSQYDWPISAALCSLSPGLGLQMAGLPRGVRKVTWSASSGTMIQHQDWLVLDTTGLSGKAITVTATITGDSWNCSSTIPTSVAVPSAAFPASK